MTPKQLGVLVRTRERRVDQALVEVRAARAGLEAAERARDAVEVRRQALASERLALEAALQREVFAHGMSVCRYRQARERNDLIDERIAAARDELAAAAARVGEARALLDERGAEWKRAHHTADRMADLRRRALADVRAGQVRQEERMTEDLVTGRKRAGARP